MSSTAAAKTTTEVPAASGARHVAKIPPTALKLQSEGQCWREWELRLPKGTELADVYADPSLFSGIQGSRFASLRRLDKIRILPFDESWVCETYVTGASDRGLNFSKPVRTELPARTESLFQDGRYRIEWNGSGYQVVRMGDGHVMATGFSNEALALKGLQDLYPRPAA